MENDGDRTKARTHLARRIAPLPWSRVRVVGFTPTLFKAELNALFLVSFVV